MGGSLGGGSNAKQQRAVGSLQFQTSLAGGVIPLIYGTTKVSPNLLDYDDFTATPSKQAGGKGKGGGGGKGGGQQYMYSASFIMGICQGPIAGLGLAWWDKNIGTAAGLPSISSINPGADGQTIDPYWSSAHPAKPISYSSTANIVFANYQLGNTATLPNFNFEVFGVGTGVSGASPNGYDANPAQIVSDFLTNPRYGTNFPSANLDPAMTSSAASSYASYCAAVGLFLSPLLDQQQEAQQSLADITKVTNSAIVWSGGLLKIIPYGDHSVTNAFTVASFTGAPTQAGGDTIGLTFTDPSFNRVLPTRLRIPPRQICRCPGQWAGSRMQSIPMQILSRSAFLSLGSAWPALWSSSPIRQATRRSASLVAAGSLPQGSVARQRTRSRRTRPRCTASARTTSSFSNRVLGLILA